VSSGTDVARSVAATDDTRVLSENAWVRSTMTAATGAGHAASASGGYRFSGFKGKTAAR